MMAWARQDDSARPVNEAMIISQAVQQTLNARRRPDLDIGQVLSCATGVAGRAVLNLCVEK